MATLMDQFFKTYFVSMKWRKHRKTNCSVVSSMSMWHSPLTSNLREGFTKSRKLIQTINRPISFSISNHIWRTCYCIIAPSRAVVHYRRERKRYHLGSLSDQQDHSGLRSKALEVIEMQPYAENNYSNSFYPELFFSNRNPPSVWRTPDA